MLLYMWALIWLVGVSANTLHDGHERKSMIKPGAVQKYTIPQHTLGKDKTYEIRISYLGTVGASVKLEWDCDKAASRRLKDTEKLVFTTDFEGKIKGNCYSVRVQAYRSVRSVNKKAEEQPIWYIIKLEKYSDSLYVPESVVPMFIGLATALFMAIIIYRLFINVYKQILEDEKTKLSKKTN